MTDQSELFREIHAAHQILEARVGAQTVDADVRSQKVRKVSGSYLIGFFQELQCSVFISQSGVDRCNHIR